MSVVRASLGLLVALASVAACGGSDRPTWAGNSSEVRINAREYAFVGADRTRPGVVAMRLTNTGEEPHQAAFFRLHQGVRLPEALDAYRRDPSGAAAARLMSPAGGANTILPGRSQRFALRLAAGGYALFCFVRGGNDQLHAQRGMVAGLTVTGIPSRSSPPRAAGTVVLRDAAVELPPALVTAGATIRVRNEGARLHELALLRIPGGRTAGDLTAWLDALSRGAAAGPAPFLEAGGVAALPPRGEAWLRPDFDAGTHVAASFAAAADGRADALGGVLAPFAVP